jgi:MSHA biogenesis protein MshO
MQISSRKLINNNSGFTLLELIIVIVILGIMAFSLSGVIKTSVYGYIDAKDRNRLSQSAKWIIERISRELREALPQSVRTNDDGNDYCVEFMSIDNASSYLNLPTSPNAVINSFKAVGFDLTTSSATRVAIMPISTSAVYNVTGTLGSIASISNLGGADTGKVSISLSGGPRFDRRSPTNRFYLLNDPISFCLNNSSGEITRYTDYGINAIQQLPPLAGSDSLIGENFSLSGYVFNYQAETLTKSGLLQINLLAQNRSRNLSGNEESFNIFHEVHIRNVP